MWSQLSRILHNIPGNGAQNHIDHHPIALHRTETNMFIDLQELRSVARLGSRNLLKLLNMKLNKQLNIVMRFRLNLRNVAHVQGMNPSTYPLLNIRNSPNIPVSQSDRQAMKVTLLRFIKTTASLNLTIIQNRKRNPQERLPCQSLIRML